MKARCICGAEFRNKKEKQRHKRSGKCPERYNTMKFKHLPDSVVKDTRLDIFDDDDLPDGAYFALIEEYGVGYEE